MRLNISPFVDALIGGSKSNKIPDAHNYFANLIGEWDIEWHDHLKDAVPRCVKGEWLFAWILEGAGIQDVFIVPSREERLKNPQADAEYGTTVRLYNPKHSAWDIFYGCTGSAFRLTAILSGEDIVLTENSEGQMRYVFFDITSDAFKWKKEYRDTAGPWEAIAKIQAVRKHGTHATPK